MIKRIFVLLICLCLLVSATGCAVPSYYMELGEELLLQQMYDALNSAAQNSQNHTQAQSIAPSYESGPECDYDLKAIESADLGSKDDTWAIYWYLCGSDLESQGGYATYDLMEMTKVKLPKNVTVVIQTGGSSYWHNNTVSAKHNERYVYNSEGLHRAESNPAANMGDSDTLADFLTFCNKNFPADKTMALIWNHGGGSVAGAAFDQNYYNDALNLGEMYEAFNEAFELSNDNPPLDVIGFDACLMATVDVAFTFCDVAKYLVASEELEPGDGWDYEAWLSALAADPAMGGAKLGKVICDSYKTHADSKNQGSQITLSVTDLTKLQPLLSAYDAMGQEALKIAVEDSSFFTSFSRLAARCENYGGNNYQEGYTNMVDLGHLARSAKDLLPETSQAVLDGLKHCVIYRVAGPYHNQATGLSCYYSYNGDRTDLNGYTQHGYSQAFKYLYSYGITGRLSADGMNYVNQLGYSQQELPEVPSLESPEFTTDLPVTLSDDGYAMLDVGPELANVLSGVYFYLSYVSTSGDTMLFMGRDNDIDADYVNGIFMDNFRGVWGSIDGHFVYMNIIYESDDYNIYAVPILLNGELYNLRVAYDFSSGKYSILGARQGLDTSGKPDKNLVPLYVGDEISTVYYASSFSGDDDFELYKMETFTVNRNTSFYEKDLGDGEFILIFELVDAKNNSVWSDPVFIEVHGDDIYVSTGVE